MNTFRNVLGVAMIAAILCAGIAGYVVTDSVTNGTRPPEWAGQLFGGGAAVMLVGMVLVKLTEERL